MLQVRPAVIPLLQQLLTSGTFWPSSLDAKSPASSASSSSPATDPQASETRSSEPQASGTAEQAAPSNMQEEEEQCRARLIFTAENNVPWIDKLVTQIKVSAFAGSILVCLKLVCHSGNGALSTTPLASNNFSSSVNFGGSPQDGHLILSAA